MGSVGLLLVGVVLFVNGLSSLGVLSGRSAAPLNLFVGAAQVVFPTIVLLQSGGDPAIVNATWPSLLFGFTYLWFGLINIAGFEPAGFGWYSVFVVAIALFQAARSLSADPAFAVIWLTWAIMWGLFFLLLGLRVTRIGNVDLGRFAGWFLVLLGIPSCTIPGILQLEGAWVSSPFAGAVALVVLAVGFALSAVLARPRASETSDESSASAAEREVASATA